MIGNLIHEDIGPSGKDPFPCTGYAPYTTSLREGIQSIGSIKDSFCDMPRGARIVFTNMTGDLL